jgi:hypothetical protein
VSGRPANRRARLRGDGEFPEDFLGLVTGINAAGAAEHPLLESHGSRRALTRWLWCKSSGSSVVNCFVRDGDGDGAADFLEKVGLRMRAAGASALNKATGLLRFGYTRLLLFSSCGLPGGDGPSCGSAECVRGLLPGLLIMDGSRIGLDLPEFALVSSHGSNSDFGSCSLGMLTPDGVITTCVDSWSDSSYPNS